MSTRDSMSGSNLAHSQDLHHDLLQQARARQKTQIFKQDYAKHRSGVEGSLSATLSNPIPGASGKLKVAPS
jgi:hypothetical protein